MPLLLLLLLVVELLVTIELLFSCKNLLNLDVNCCIKDPSPLPPSVVVVVVVAGRDSVDVIDECNHTSIRIVVSKLPAVAAVLVGCFLLFDLLLTPKLDDDDDDFRMVATMPLINGANVPHSSEMAKRRHIRKYWFPASLLLHSRRMRPA